MTVSELIEVLSNYPPDSVVTLQAGDDPNSNLILNYVRTGETIYGYNVTVLEYSKRKSNA